MTQDLLVHGVFMVYAVSYTHLDVYKRQVPFHYPAGDYATALVGGAG